MLKKIISLSVVAIVAFSGCSSKETDTTNRIKKEMSPEHKAKSKEIKILMHEIQSLINETSKDELELDDDRRRYAVTLADVVDKLSNEIEKNATFKRKKEFAPYLVELRDSAGKFRVIAKNYELEKLQGNVDYLKKTCKKCHTEKKVKR